MSGDAGGRERASRSGGDNRAAAFEALGDSALAGLVAHVREVLGEDDDAGAAIGSRSVAAAHGRGKVLREIALEGHLNSGPHRCSCAWPSSLVRRAAGAARILLAARLQACLRIGAPRALFLRAKAMANVSTIAKEHLAGAPQRGGARARGPGLALLYAPHFEQVQPATRSTEHGEVLDRARPGGRHPRPGGRRWSRRHASIQARSGVLGT